MWDRLFGTFADERDGPITYGVRTPLRSIADAVAIVGAGPKLLERDVDVKSSYFEVRGQLRLENRVLESRSLVERRSGLQVLAIQRQQQASLLPAAR